MPFISRQKKGFWFLLCYLCFYNDQNILTTVYLKETDHQSYLHNKSEHPLCLKKSIQFRPELRLKWMCSTITAFKDEFAKLVAWGYKADDIKEKVQQVSNIPREILYIWQYFTKDPPKCFPIREKTLVWFEGKNRKPVGNTIINNQVKRTTKENMNRKCSPCNSRKKAVCCRQVKTTTSFKSYKNKNF